jgi:hypothetical protein
MPAAELTRFLVEWYWPNIDDESVDECIARLVECARSLSLAGSAVQLLMTVAVPADEVVLAVFDSTSPRTVAEVYVLAGVRAQRLTSAVEARLWSAFGRETPDSTEAFRR